MKNFALKRALIMRVSLKTFHSKVLSQNRWMVSAVVAWNFQVESNENFCCRSFSSKDRYKFVRRSAQHTQMQPTIDPNFVRTRSLELFGSSVELRNCAPWTGQLHVWTGYLNGVSELPSRSVWITRQANQIGWLSHFKVGEHWQPKVRFVRDDGNHSDWCSLELLAVCRAFLSRSF